MATYERIYKDWFFHRIPRGLTFQEFEASSGEEDREATGAVLQKMRIEIPRTFRRLFDIRKLPPGVDGIKAIDVLLTPKIAEGWMATSDPDDPNNEFKLTLSEFAVVLGDVVASELAGEWHFSRMPNYFESTIRVEGFEMSVFQTVMKKCSDDFGHETLDSKYETFSKLVEARRGREGHADRVQ